MLILMWTFSGKMQSPEKGYDGEGSEPSCSASEGNLGYFMWILVGNNSCRTVNLGTWSKDQHIISPQHILAFVISYCFLEYIQKHRSLDQDATPAKKETKKAQLPFSSKGKGLVHVVVLKSVYKFLNTSLMKKWSLILHFLYGGWPQ